MWRRLSVSKAAEEAAVGALLSAMALVAAQWRNRRRQRVISGWRRNIRNVAWRKLENMAAVFSWRQRESGEENGGG